METKFKAPKGQTTKIMTLLTLLLCVVAVIKLVLQIVNTNRFPIGILVVVVIVVLVIVMSYLLSPAGYVLSDNELIINQPVRSKKIRYKEILGVRHIQKEELRGMIRTFGIGGLFGQVGKFYHKNFGTMNLFVSQLKNLVLIETANKKYLISPDTIDFLEKIKGKIPYKK